jgi:hypothetical protein
VVKRQEFDDTSCVDDFPSERRYAWADYTATTVVETEVSWKPLVAAMIVTR